MKTFCVVAFVVAAALLTEAHSHRFGWGSCFDKAKFSTYASTPEGCEDLAPPAGAGERHGGRKTREHAQECFVKAGNFVDQATNATNIAALKEALNQVTTTEKAADVSKAVDDANTEKIDIIPAEKSVEFYKRFVKEMKKACNGSSKKGTSKQSNSNETSSEEKD